MNGGSVYSAYGLSVYSELPLPELGAGLGPPDVWIRRGSVQMDSRPISRQEQFIYGSQVGAFHLSGGTEIVVEPRKGADDASVRIVLLGRVMACLLWQRGWLPLHSSGVTIDDQVVLIAGPSGMGKSTLAAALHARGHRVVTDDVAPVRISGGECIVLPSWPRLRLLPQSLTTVESMASGGLFRDRVFQVDKYNVNLQQTHGAYPIAVRQIYFLDEAAELRSEPVGLPLATASLNHHSFVRQGRCDEDAARHHLELCSAVASRVPVRHMKSPKLFTALPDLVRLIEEECKTYAG
jgi:hypothetical protein